MISYLALYGAPLLLLIWLAGLARAWRGKPKVSCWAAGAGIVLGIVCVVSASEKRPSNFWTGDLGQGDGLALLGLLFEGFLITGASLALLFLAAVVASLRAKKINQGVPE